MRPTNVSYLLCIVILILASSSNLHAEPKENAKPSFETRVLFEKVRIPKIVVTMDGTVLAFADRGAQLRRSTDNGMTWSSIEQLDSAGSSMVVDEKTGDVLVVRPSRSYLLRSKDQGQTWSKEKITVKPNAAGHGVPGKVSVDVTCSESGITLRHGKHAGRLLLPGRCQPPDGNNAQEYWPYNYNTSLFSDDGGQSWQTGYPVQSGTGEGTLAELADGRIYYNSRCHMAVDHRRRIAWSHDGGNMWVDWEVSMDLFEAGEPFYFKYGTKPSYGCNAGLVRLPDEVTGGKDVLLFSTLDSPGGHRFKISVWASFDGAKTWPIKRLVHAGPSSYSSLAAAKDGTVFLLYEDGEKKLYERVSLARFNMQWLTDRADWRTLLAK